ncbi:hypothetical protein NQ318_019683 [Aromia moschata]|uniref:ENT domain-containing protein n=1 Tax=Aromia moschata TaxID=1265417 RepID=A0AAV8Z5B5_9CUCU|nr:hypothetical protein NQ318_019683 [Aromia moschata]
MWPLLLDMTKEESIQNLRNLELEAYAHLVSALRAQGPLNSDKRRLLKDTSIALNITQERHKAEVRRAISDEKLNTIAYHVTGHTESLEDWAQEGRRLVPLLPRTAPQTAFSALADETADAANQSNKQLPSPKAPFRIPDPPKAEESKKRKVPICPENSSLAQHLLTPKFCRIQQLYRRTKYFQAKVQAQDEGVPQEARPGPARPHPAACASGRAAAAARPVPRLSAGPPVTQKVNVLQNISLHPIKDEVMAVDQEEAKVCEQPPSAPICSNENQAPRPKLLTSIKPNASITLKQTQAQPPGPSGEPTKSLKMCSTKKPVTKTVNSGQKLIVVSSAQTIPSNSILQRTLQIPFVKNVSIKNFEKFKIVAGNSTPASIQVTNVTNSVKHKVVTVKTNSAAKKVIPLSQLQVLNSKGSIKVLPLGGKIVGKSVAAAAASPLYIMNAVGASQPFTKATSGSPAIATSKIQTGAAEEIRPAVDGVTDPSEKASPRSPGRENGKSSVLEDIMKASGVISEECVAEDYDTKIEEFHIPQNKHREVEGDVIETADIRNEGENVTVRNDEAQNYDYEVLPVLGVEENMETTDISEYCVEIHTTNQSEMDLGPEGADNLEKEDAISSELIESENLSGQGGGTERPQGERRGHRLRGAVAGGAAGGVPATE